MASSVASPAVGLPREILDTARLVQSRLQKLRGQLVAFPGGEHMFRKSLVAMSSLEGVLKADLDVSSVHLLRKRVSIRSLQNRVTHLKRKRRQDQAKLHTLEATKISGRIQNIWFVRVAMADPSVAVETLERFCTFSCIGDQINKQGLHRDCQGCHCRDH